MRGVLARPSKPAGPLLSHSLQFACVTILRLLHLKGGTARGNLLFKGEDLIAKTETEMRSLRGREMSIVLQSPVSSLNPVLRIGSQLSEAWRAHAGGTREECAATIRAALANVSLPNDSDFQRRPSQLSVGQAQRVIIAMAILHRPSLLIADEATSALDTITQSEILRLFAQLNRQLGMGILYISHDLLSVAALCHRIAILNAGEIVECGPPSQIFGAPQHSYTQKLVAALPRGPFLNFHSDKLGSLAANDDKDGCAKQSEESSIPDQIPSIAR